MNTIRVVSCEEANKILGRTRRARTEPVVSNRVLRFHDVWRNEDRTLRWQGPCLNCGRQTWAFDDGENDPRGFLGEAALYPVLIDGPDGAEFAARACAVCGDNYETWQAVKAEVLRIGTVKSAPYNWGAE